MESFFYSKKKKNIKNVKFNRGVLSWNFPNKNTGGIKYSLIRKLPFPSPGNLSDPGIEPRSHALQVVSCIAGKFFTNWANREDKHII